MIIVCIATTDMDSLYECLKSPTKYGYEVEYFWISGVALVFVGFLGFIGNIRIALAIMNSNRQLKSDPIEH